MSLKALLQWAKEPPRYVTHSAVKGKLAEFRKALEVECFMHEGKPTAHCKVMRQAAKDFDALVAREALTAHTRGGRPKRLKPLRTDLE